MYLSHILSIYLLLYYHNKEMIIITDLHIKLLKYYFDIFISQTFDFELLLDELFLCLELLLSSDLSTFVSITMRLIKNINII
jgi:hypothetical protein